MSCIVFQTNPKTGIRYAYESFSYWDKEKKQPRSKRKHLGRVDPQTGEIIRSGRGEQPLLSAAGGQETAVSPTVMELQKELTAKNARISRLEEELAALSKNTKRSGKRSPGSRPCLLPRWRVSVFEKEWRESGLLLQIKNLKEKAAAYKSGERYKKLREEHRKELAVTDRRIRELEREVVRSHVETVDVRNIWMRANEDVLKETDRTIAKKERELKKARDEKYRAERERDEALGELRAAKGHILSSRYDHELLQLLFEKEIFG